MTSSKINVVINALVNELFKKEMHRLKEKDLELVRMNREVSKDQTDGFFYKGQFYTDLTRDLAVKGIKTNLHPSLVPEIEKHIKDRSQIEFDMRRIKQALVIALTDCFTAQDFRDALPNALGDMIDQIRVLPRTRPEGFNIVNDNRKYQQYQKLREKIEFYVATRLLY